MPFDGTNFADTKPDVFSVESFIAWAEKQPADLAYEWFDPRQCLLSQWLGGLVEYGKFCRTHSISIAMERAIAYPPPHIVGAALSRAKTFLAERGR